MFYGPLTYDDNGQVTHEFTPAEDQVRFGHIKINSGIKPEGSGWTYSKDLLIPYHSQPYFVGIKSDAHYRAVNEPINLETILVDYNGQTVDFEAMSILAQPLSGPKNNRPKTTEQACPVDQPCALKLQQPGRYQLQVKVAKAGHEYENDAMVIYITDAINPYSQEADKSTRIVANQEAYQVGDVATIEVLFPDNQVKSAVFVERNQVLNAWHKSTADGTIQVSFEITEDHSPGFSVNTAILTINDQAKHLWPKPVKEVTQHFTVEPPPEPAHFSFAPNQRQYQPGDEVVLDIHSEFSEPAEFTVAVIDEAVIGFVNPAHYYDLSEAHLGLALQGWVGMNRFELYPFTLLKIDEPADESATIRANEDWVNSHDYVEEQGRIMITGSRIRREDLGAYAPMVDGGFLAPPKGSDEVLKDPALIPVGPMRLDPRYLRTLFKESAHFHTGIQVFPGQSATHTFTLPDNMGSWRVVVVGTDQTGLLDIQHQIIQASKPLELYAKLPDQVTVGDRFTGRLAVVSKSDDPGAIEMAATAQSNQALLSESHEHFDEVQNNRQYNLSLPIDTPSANPIQVLAMAQDDLTADGLQQLIPVRKAEITVNQQLTGEFSAHHQNLVFSYENPMVDAQATLNLQISQSLYSQLRPTIEYMKSYPHACWEQKLSKAVAMLVELKLDTAMSPTDQALSRGRIEDLLQQAVDFQASNGGMTFFNARPDQVNAYLTFHTHHMFNYFVEQGFAVPKLVHQELAAFAEEYMETYHDFIDEPPQPDDDVSYLLHPELYLMASEVFQQSKLNGQRSSRGLTWSQRRLQEDNLETLSSITDAVDEASLYSLINLMRLNLPATVLTERINQSYFKNGAMFSLLEQKVSDWRLMNSPLKSQCETINAFLQQSNHEALKSVTYPHILAVLDAGQDTGIIGSTLENSLCLVAIQQFIDTFEDRDAVADPGQTISVTINDHAVPLQQNRLVVDISTAHDTTVTIHNPDQHQWYYSAQVAYPISAKTPPKVGFGLELKRTHQRFTDQGWQPFGADELTTGDWVKTQLIINNPTDRSFIALSSPNPGAWLPFDITLATTAPAGIMAQNQAHWNSPYFYHRQLLPDTSLFYADHLPAGIHQVTYYSQVMVAGEFSLLPAQVEAMYNREITAQTPYEMVRVK